MLIPMFPKARGVALASLALLGAAAVSGAFPGTAAAQTGSARILLVDDETGDPIPGVTVKIKGRADVTTDESGKALLEDLPAGRVELEFRALGFLGRKDVVNIQADRTIEHRFGLSFTGDQLPELIVETRRERLANRYQDFHRRMAAGNGVFITWEEIKARRYTRLGDALRNIRGVRVYCRTLDCQVFMSRSSSCSPTVWVDGIEVEYFGVNSPIGDIYGIEVYRGSGEMPGEYAGTSACGAIVVWTKNRPYK